MTKPISLQEIQDYRDSEGVSQSQLKLLLSKGTKGFKPSLTTLLGSYLDCKITCSHLIDELYFHCDVKRPTITIQDLCTNLYQWIDKDLLLIDPSQNLEDYRDVIEDWIQTQSYYANRPNTRVDTFIKEAKEWWKVLVQKGEREIITSVEELETELMVMMLQGDHKLSWLWKGEFQKPFYWKEEGIDCKGLGDIVHPSVYVDLKYTTCDSIRDWWKVCASLNYPFQMAFYKSGLEVEKCYWLVVNKNWYELIEVSELMLQIGKWGYTVNKKMQIGKVEKKIELHFNGYMDGLNLLNGTVSQETNDELYLSNLI